MEELEKKKENSTDLEALKKVLQELEKKDEDLKKKEAELSKKEKLTPWNVDTIGHEGFTKTVINKKPGRKDEDSLSDEEKEKRMRQFIKENEKTLKKFGMLRRYDDSKQFLQEHPNIVCENTANYLVIWCVNLEVEEVCKTLLICFF